VQGAVKEGHGWWWDADGGRDIGLGEIVAPGGEEALGRSIPQVPIRVAAGVIAPVARDRLEVRGEGGVVVGGGGDEQEIAHLLAAELRLSKPVRTLGHQRLPTQAEFRILTRMGGHGLRKAASRG